MLVLKSGNWKRTWYYYNDKGPASTYYRKSDIVRVLQYYGYTGDELPGQSLNEFTDAGYFVTYNVEAYRVVYHN